MPFPDNFYPEPITEYYANKFELPAYFIWTAIVSNNPKILVNGQDSKDISLTTKSEHKFLKCLFRLVVQHEEKNLICFGGVKISNAADGILNAFIPSDLQ